MMIDSARVVLESSDEHPAVEDVTIDHLLLDLDDDDAEGFREDLRALFVEYYDTPVSVYFNDETEEDYS